MVDRSRDFGRLRLGAVVVLLALAPTLACLRGDGQGSAGSAQPPLVPTAGQAEAPAQTERPAAAADPAPAAAAALGVPSPTTPAASATGPAATALAVDSHQPSVQLPQSQGGDGGDDSEWRMLAANPQRTSWVSEEVRGTLNVEWYRPIEPYVPYKVQVVAADGRLYIATARGLYALDATNGDMVWVYPTEMPLGHSPTVARIGGRSVVFVGGYDRRIHAVDALTGQPVPGYVPHEAGAGFETNPLVVDGVIYAGNRDGFFYALDAVSGAMKWRYETGGPILLSAAYKEGVVYFAANDARAYALKASDGSLVWKSERLPGQGFHSFWPVVYADRATGRDYVVFTTGENYRQLDLSLTEEETSALFAGIPAGELIGPLGSAPGAWAPGTVTVDVSRITDYYEEHPYRRTVIVLDRSTGEEYTFDSDGDGRPEYAPFSWSGTTHSGSKYPPVVNGRDGVYYQDTAYYSGGWVSRGGVVGWQLGTDTVSRVSEFGRPDQGEAHASDEPRAYSSGGRVVYMTLCCDRMAAAFDVTLPFGHADASGQPRFWTYWEYSLPSLAPGYQQMYYDGDDAVYTQIDGWQVYSGRNQSKNGIYMKHSSTQSPPIPYRGRVYVLKGNAVIAFGPGATGAAPKPPAAVEQAPPATVATSAADVRQLLSREIQKMLAAGHLRPGYHAAGFIDLYGVGNYTDEREFGELFDYFQNPADTVATLLQALPYLSPAEQAQVKTYVQTHYGPGAPYSFTNVVHVGWNAGAPREVYEIPPDIWASKYADFGPRRTPICGECGYWRWFPPYSFYAGWKYAETFPGTAKAILAEMGGKIEPPPADEYLVRKPYFANLYLAGYQGYLELQRLAGYSEDATVRGWYEHLLRLRVSSFAKDTPYFGEHTVGLMDYNRTLSVARNFMFLTPELGEHLHRNALPAVRAAVDEYADVAPYWFVAKFDGSYGEGTLQHLYDYPALFQAKAYVLKQPFAELARWLDVPGFACGDLFYIQNLIAILHSSA